MKNKIIATITLVCVVFALASCTSKEKKGSVKNTGNLANLPAWVIDAEVEGGIAAVGIASPSRGGIKFQIPKAEMDAKANIAAIIQSDMSRVTKSALREANVNDVNDVEEFFSQATKEVVQDLPLSGVKRINIFQAPDGTLYVHMLLKNEDYSKYLLNSERNFEARLKRSGLARENIDKSQEAVKTMFDELEKERAKN